MKGSSKFIIACLAICILIYGLCRPGDVLMQRIFGLFISSEFLESTRNWSRAHLPEWFIYSLPGALWVCTATLSVLNGSRHSARNIRIGILLFIFSVPMVMEFMQLIHLTDGTFDLIDIMFYVIGIGAGITAHSYSQHQITRYRIETLGWKWAAAFFLSILIFGDQLRL